MNKFTSKQYREMADRYKGWASEMASFNALFPNSNDCESNARLESHLKMFDILTQAAEMAEKFEQTEPVCHRFFVDGTWFTSGRSAGVLKKSLNDDGIDAEIEALYAAPQAQEGMKLVPVEPAESQWDGLARDIMVTLRQERPTPRKIFAELEGRGTPIPQWLRDEQEMKNLDHVPSKGTCCVIIYKAMIGKVK